MLKPIQAENAKKSRSLACERVPTRTIDAITPMIVPKNRKAAFSKACPRVLTAKIPTVMAAEAGDSSSSQKPAYKAMTTASHTRMPKAQEAEGTPAKSLGAGAVLTLMKPSPCRSLALAGQYHFSMAFDVPLR